MFRFEDPSWLYLLLLLPLAGWYAFHFRKNCLLHSEIKTFARIKKRTGPGWRNIKLVLQLAAVGLVIIALARPQLGYKKEIIHTFGTDVLLCIDASGSMQALDFSLPGEKTDRLGIVKERISEFVQSRSGDRIGAVVFGQEAFTLCPLTLDYAALLRLLKGVEIGVAGDSTALGPALVLAAKRLSSSKSPSKVIVLLTDGKHNAGSVTPLQAAYAARSLGIRVYTVGIGDSGAVPFEINTPLGKQTIYKKIDTDCEALKNIAGITGGKYFQARDDNSVKRVCREISGLQKNITESRGILLNQDLYPWAGILAVSLIALVEMLSNAVFKEFL